LDDNELTFSSNLIESASMLRIFYEALVNEEFEEEQAFTMVVQFEIVWFESLLSTAGIIEEEEDD
jgi:hypothetical protein